MYRVYMFMKFNFNKKSDSVNFFNNFLEKFNLFTLEHRIVYRIFCLSFNLFNNKNSPPNLTKKISSGETSRYN